MTFTYSGVDLSKIIGALRIDGNNFSIYYLDGTVSTYVCTDEDEKKKIKDIMIKQAIERQATYDIKILDMRNKLSIMEFLLATFGASYSIIEKQPFFLGLNTYFLYSSIKTHIETKGKLKELKKYKMFLELLDNLKDINSGLSENELPLDIDTLDDFSYGEVKSHYKYYKPKDKPKLII